MKAYPKPQFPEPDFTKIKTYSAVHRHNLVTINGLKSPGDATIPYDPDGFAELAQRIFFARENGRPVIFSMGAHVIKCGLSRYVIDLIRQDIITHVAGNGAVSIHDFELAMLGGTSEDVPTAIEDGSFGMWEETGRYMNAAIRAGAKNGLGYGESLAAAMAKSPELYPYREDSVVYNSCMNNCPATFSIALGTDIIHQHPACDFAAIGTTVQRDFHIMARSIAALDGGVFLNFGSAVIGPEVFLKCLAIARNLGYMTENIVTANFDLQDLGDFRAKISCDDPNYYYRPRKNIVNRPTSRGGIGWHFVGDHAITIPALHALLTY